MKRLYVPPAYRGVGAARSLVSGVIELGRRLDYERMRLDTHSATMGAAVKLYRQFGFVEVAAAPVLPIEGLLYLELRL